MKLWERTKNHKLLALSSLVMIFLSWKIYFMQFPVADFSDTVLSMASAKNVDMGSVVFWYFVYAVPLSLLFAYGFRQTDLFERIRQWWSGLVIPWDASKSFAIALVLSQLLLGDMDWIPRMSCLAIAVVCYFHHKWEYETGLEELLLLWLFFLLSFAVPIFLIGQYVPLYVAFGLFAVLSVSVCLSVGKTATGLERAFSCLHPFMVAAAVDAVLLFAGEVLLLRGGSFHDIFLFFPHVIAALSLLIKRESFRMTRQQAIFLACLLLISTALPSLGEDKEIDFFEGANHGLSIQAAIEGTGLPIIDNLDAHLLAYTIGGIAYYALTGDYLGALAAPYGELLSMLLAVAGLYFLLSRFLDETRAFLVLALFPWGSMNVIFPGLAALAVFLFWKGKPCLFSDVLLVIFFVFLSLYRIDLGASIGAALALCPMLYYLAYRKYAELIRFLLVFLVLLCLVTFVAYELCIRQNVDFFTMADSFLTAFRSNQHWGYGNLGAFWKASWFYFLVPVVLAIYILPVIRRMAEGNDANHDWLLTFLYVAFAFNIQRAVIRHTLAESSVVCYTFAVLLLAILVMQKRKNHRSFVLVSVLFVCSYVLGNHGIQSHLSGVCNMPSLVASIHREERELYHINKGDKKQIGELKTFFDRNLGKDKTYFDMTNQALFFAYVGRKNPVYINQCPGMINGKRGQLQALASLEAVRPPFVLMPSKHRYKADYGCYTIIDGIQNTDRYYLLLEYVAEHYRPYCNVGDFAVWCRKSDYEDLRSRDELAGYRTEYLDYAYEPEESHLHNLGAIPYLWGNYASEEDKRGAYISLVRAGDGWAIASSIQGKQGFLVMDIDAVEEGEAKLYLHGGDVADVVYHFDVLKGRHRYRLRVSSDVLWYAGQMERMVFEDSTAQVAAVEFQDTSK